MIAMLVGDEGMRRGPIPVAFAHAGFEPRPASTTDEAERELAACSTADCVLVVDASWLEQRSGSESWRSFLSGHRNVATVVVARARAASAARLLAGEPHRILIENPFDAAAVVAAAERAASRRAAARRAPQRLSEAAG